VSHENITEKEFFQFIRSQEGRWELADGRPVEVASTTQRHRDIAANTLYLLHTQLRGSSCRPTAIQTGVSTRQGTVRYPDIVVDCGALDDDALVATEPTIIIELLPRADLEQRMLEYASTPGTTCVLLIDSGSKRVVLCDRDREDWFEKAYHNVDDVIKLPIIDVELALRDVYFGIQF